MCSNAMQWAAGARRLSHNEKSVLLALAYLANANLEGRTSVQRLMSAAVLTEGVVRETISGLYAGGIISCHLAHNLPGNLVHFDFSLKNSAPGCGASGICLRCTSFEHVQAKGGV